MSRQFGILMVAVVSLMAGGAMVYAMVTSPAPVAEDDPGWNCATDGNRMCGPSIYEQVKRAQCDVWLITHAEGREPSDADLSVYAQCLAFEEGD